MRFETVASLALAAGIASAHPGQEISHEVAERRDYHSKIERADLSHCAETLAARGITQRNVARRAAAANSARVKRGLKARTLDEALNTDHDKSSLGYTPSTDPETLFEDFQSCLLYPEVTQGPYYVGGEYIRADVTDDSAGVPLTLDMQLIDIDTCEPIPDVYVELWHCNAMGVYSGVGDELDSTFLRGIQPTTEDGVAQFETVFPGHYQGRATHMHLMLHSDVTEVYDNGTLGNFNLKASHVGQVFFDQDLITLVETTSPYSENQAQVTANEDDGILAGSAEGEGVDPMMSYTLLDDSVADGLFAWIAFGVNTTRSEDITPAAFYYEGGGETNPNGGGGGGGGPGGPPS